MSGEGLLDVCNQTESGSMLQVLFVFLHNSKFPAKSWQDPASIEGEGQNKKMSLPRIEPQPPDQQSHAMPTVTQGICSEGDF